MGIALYELNEKLSNFEFEIDDETGEILNADELEAIELERDEKIENICLLYKNSLADAAAYKAEKDLLAKKEKSAKKKAEWCKNYLAVCLQGEKFATPRVSISYRVSHPLMLADGAVFPDEYYKVERKPDNEKIKAALKAGVEIEGAYIADSSNIQIK